MILRGVLCCRALFHLWNRVGLNGGHMLWIVANWGALLALIGAVPGGKKGAAIGATAGGVGGLIYDLATRDRDKGK
jgi:hypothetical protein